MQLVLYEVSMSAITVGSRGGDLSTHTTLTNGSLSVYSSIELPILLKIKQLKLIYS
nr:MAG TPA: hypothetical protein [Crassvirales sp.]DAL80312.1 MAG TPA: hypothetical protein [Caudoviricetes sp.]DAR45693.1 MAG TPA: hypothetical protein [Bacteriophage sp.]DAU06226.1 MAG TPA: hypothetical protein [Caudoviricetes sp.]DAX21815.1 MAG TPA: hypothetical protein [Caudoviricetes sp.]